MQISLDSVTLSPSPCLIDNITFHMFKFVSVLKFSEVYFNSAMQKVFDVVLNNDHSIVSDLDIFAMVGHGVAHDEIIPFSISDGMLRVQVSRAKVWWVIYVHPTPDLLHPHLAKIRV